MQRAESTMRVGIMEVVAFGWRQDGPAASIVTDSGSLKLVFREKRLELESPFQKAHKNLS
jgi:hypothetical protein